MAVDQNEQFMTNLMKVYKFEWAHATTQLARDQAAGKADALRANAKSMGIDLSAYSTDIPWGDKRLPGGNVIDWGLVSRVGKEWSLTNPIDDVSKWKQSVGSGLTTNLAGYEADYASFSESAAYDTVGGKTKMAQPTMWQLPGAGVANPILSNVGPPVVTPSAVTPEVPQVPVTPNRTVEGLGQMAGSQATALQAARPVKPVEAPAADMEWTQPMGLNGAWEQTPIKSVEELDAEKSMASDPVMLAAFLKENPDVDPDNTMWTVPTINRFNTWASNHIEQAVQLAIITNGESYDPTKDPLWSAYEPLLVARDNMTKASLKTALDLKINAINQQSADVKANYDFQIAEIDNALNMANWASGQQLAASGVILTGALSWALQANEQQGINQKFLSVQNRTNFLNKLSGDINILTADYADQGTLIDKVTIAEIGVRRLELLQGNSEEVKAAKLLLLTLQEKAKAINIAAPGIAKAEQAGITAAAETIDFERTLLLGQADQSGIYMTKGADGKYTFKTGLTTDQKLAQDRFVLDNFIQRQGIQLDWAANTLDKRKQDFYEWATKAGLKLDQKQLDLAWAELDGAMVRAGWKKDASGNYTYTGAGQTTTTTTTGAETPYMEDKGGFTADMNIVNNSKEVGTNNYQQAVLRVGLGSGGLLADDSAFLMALTGAPKSKVPAWWASLSGNTPFGGMSGALTSADEATVARLADIADEKSPSRALELYVAWKIKHPPTGTTPGSTTSASAIASLCKDFGAALGYSPADISTAANWLLANIGKLTGGTP